jgi:cation diffusion facilitator CzcD-associated flavoprotein CzcO
VVDSLELHDRFSEGSLPSKVERVDVAIVGAGFGGLGLGVRLRDAGRTSLAILEADEGLGGTWRVNTYPGVACDIPSHLYSYSFAPRADWTRRYPSQPEILGYLEQVAEERGLRPHLHLGTSVTAARFEPDRDRWRLSLEGGDELEARVLATACGQLRIPHLPRFPGLEDFEGAWWHSARWDHDFDLRGKRVAVVGSGATAIQVVPELAKVAARLHVFQRTPPWIIARHDRPYARAERRLFAAVPAWRRLYRSLLFWRQEAFFLGFRPDSLPSKLLTRMARWRLESQVEDPQLRAALTPTYPIGCKRVLVSDDYFPVFNEPQVELVTSGIERFVPAGVRTRDGRERGLDAVVFATGFDSQALVAPMRVENGDGRTLDEAWRDGPYAHLGLTVPGFPNLFLLYGPNTNLGHNSIVFMMEAQIAHVLGCLDELDRRNARRIEVRPEALERFDRRAQARLTSSIWSQGCTSWYKNDVGRITNNWPGFATEYWHSVRRPRARDFALS